MYLGLFENKRDVEGNFRVNLDENTVILLAEYEYEEYSGSAYVLFYNKLDSKLYEVIAGHCSCYGLEDQWNPEEVSIELIREKLKRGAYSCIKKELKQILKEIANGVY